MTSLIISYAVLIFKLPTTQILLMATKIHCFKSSKKHPNQKVSLGAHAAKKSVKINWAEQSLGTNMAKVGKDTNQTKRMFLLFITIMHI